ncbi:unnamed protein product [Schistosoma margrebowiei]|uniref:Cation/H+ exchanger transmembrane domain-containing protein n=1 Tax=Schistosoma margrebowiei TaxID=48269 RepID=A0A183LJH9_9TREM|nr:unnamed protein product [Schistosoma margrebowiei]
MPIHPKQKLECLFLSTISSVSSTLITIGGKLEMSSSDLYECLANERLAVGLILRYAIKSSNYTVEMHVFSRKNDEACGGRLPPERLIIEFPVRDQYGKFNLSMSFRYYNLYYYFQATFDPEFFFNVLLPPIIFSAGYSMKRVFLVTVLAIFSDLKVDVNLYALVFGESVLNDALAIALAQSIEKYGSISAGNFDGHAFLSSVLNFFIMFGGSFVTGVSIGCVTSLLTKFTHIKEHPLLETALFVLMSYSTFLFAETVGFTGLRGAMAFSLAIRNTSSEIRRMFFSTIIVIVMTTVLLGGCFAISLLHRLQIPVGVDCNSKNQPHTDTEEDLVDDHSCCSSHWMSFDKFYLKPLLTHSTPPLTESLPSCCYKFAKLLTTFEQRSGTFVNNDRNNSYLDNVKRDSTTVFYSNEKASISSALSMNTVKVQPVEVSTFICDFIL